MSFNRGLCLTIYIFLASALAPMLAARAQDRALESSAPVAGELATGDTHSYRISLLADQYVSLRIEQRGVDVAATLIGPDAIKRTDANFVKGTRGAESISIIADVTGDYRLEVRAAEKNAPRGAYEVTLVARRPPTDGERTLEEARRLFDQSRSLRQQGKYTDALVPAERALALREQVLGAEHTMVADSLNQIAILFDDKTDYARAEPLNVRALAIREKALGPDHPDVARSLFNLAWLAKVKEDFQTAESLYRRALDIQERALGPDHSEVATILNDLALLYHDKGNFDEAIRVNERVLAIREKALGPDDVGVAKALHNVANAYANKGDYAQAEALMRRALAIWEKAFGPAHPEVAFALDGLGKALYDNGDYTTAEPLMLRALSIREKAFGPDHLEIGPTLSYLANLYRQKGDYAKAEQVGLRDLALSEKALGSSHAYVATTLVGLATTAALQGEYEKADRLYRRALTIQETSLGPAHATVGVTLNRLGQLALDSGRPAAEAEAFFQRARVTIEKAIGPDAPGVANALIGLATLEERRGDLAEAERYYQQALAVQEKVYGPAHPAVAQSLERLAALGLSSGDVTRPVALLSRAYDIREQHLDHNLVAGSERQKLAYLNLFAQDVDRAVSLHAAAPANADALRLAFTTVLRRKGRAIDATSDNVALVRANAAPGDAALFNRLLDMRSRLATVTLRGPSGPAAVYRTQLTLLRDELDRLEGDIGARSAEFRAQSRPVTLDSVQAAVPEQAVLIEFVSYRPRGAGRETAEAPHYAAYVLAHQGQPQWVDLGEASAIDRQVSGWRRALASPSRADTARLARALDARVMQPVRGLIGNARLLLISPDGQLNLMPFAALVDEQRQYLVERYTMSYLTSGRDLLRLQIPRESRSQPVIVSAPAFGEPALATGRAAATGASRVDDSQMFFGPLPGAAGEVRALKALLPDATVLSGREATEAALRRLAGPRILHIATHGFFLDSGNAGSPPAADVPGTRLGKWAAWTENPLLRSGLALAGANQGRIGADDGVLTAFEAAGLDLWGTKLVVLAACDTGVGEVRNGDGVYGLRRALVLAGSESQMMSLWPVNDRSTRELMIAYYSRLARSVGRADALRQAQLQLLHDSPRRHPYYWASFISSGEWGTLGGRP